MTDIARAKNPDEPKDVVKNEAGLNSFTMSPTKWIEKTFAIGIIFKAGRYGGTYAQGDNYNQNSYM